MKMDVKNTKTAINPQNFAYKDIKKIPVFQLKEEILNNVKNDLELQALIANKLGIKSFRSISNYIRDNSPTLTRWDILVLIYNYLDTEYSAPYELLTVKII